MYKMGKLNYLSGLVFFFFFLSSRPTLLIYLSHPLPEALHFLSLHQSSARNTKLTPTHVLEISILPLSDWLVPLRAQNKKSPFRVCNTTLVLFTTSASIRYICCSLLLFSIPNRYFSKVTTALFNIRIINHNTLFKK